MLPIIRRYVLPLTGNDSFITYRILEYVIRGVWVCIFKLPFFNPHLPFFNPLFIGLEVISIGV